MFLLEYFFHNFQSVMSVSKYTALRDFLQVGNFTFCHFQEVIHQQSIAFSFWKFLQGSSAIHHQGHEYQCHILKRLYNLFRSRPKQPFYQQGHLAIRWKIFLYSYDGLIPCNNLSRHYGQLSLNNFQNDIELFSGSQTVFINLTSFPLWFEKCLSLFPHHIRTARCDLMTSFEKFLSFFRVWKKPAQNI